MDIPADAQRSEDGHYWWDETSQQWQPVADTQGSAGQTAAGAGQSSTDDPNQRQVVVDPGDYPTASMYVQFDSIDQLLQYIGIDPSLLQTEEDTPIA